jgi:hypothetical protein
MKVKTLVEFSGVPKNTTGICEEDWREKKVWKVTWDLERTKPLIDWFDEYEFKKYLEILST